MIHILAMKNTTKEVWVAIKAFHVGSKCAKKVTMHRSRLEWELLAPHATKHIDDLALCLTGENIDEQTTVEKLLCIVPKRYHQIAMLTMAEPRGAGRGP